MSKKWDFKNLFLGLWQVFTCKIALGIYFWVMVIFSIIAGVYHKNINVLWGFLLGLALSSVPDVFRLLCYLFLSPLSFLRELLNGREAFDALNRGFKTGEYSKSSYTSTSASSKFNRRDLVWIIILFAIPMFAGSFVISSKKADNKRTRYEIILPFVTKTK